MSSEKRIYVYFDRSNTPEEENLMGTLFVDMIRGKELFPPDSKTVANR